jgi:hypothetical protein
MIYFLKISMFSRTRLAAEALPADGEFLRVAINKDKCKKKKYEEELEYQ